MNSIILLFLAISSLLASAALGVTLGYSDTFESTVASWKEVTSTASGGPTGDFLSVTSSGAPTGQGSRPAIRNESSSWTGDYDSITHIELDVMNANASAGPLNLRLVVFSGATRFTSTAGQVVSNDGSWNRLTFSLQEADLTLIQGTGSYDDTLSSVSRLMFRHDEGGPSAQGTAMVASIGFDNITAIPEPSGVVLLLFGLPLFCARRR